MSQQPMNAPEFNMDIPLRHPWAQAVLRSVQQQWEKAPNVDAFPVGTMTFGGVECMVKLQSIGALIYGQGLAEDYIGTRWKAYLLAPPPKDGESQ